MDDLTKPPDVTMNVIDMGDVLDSTTAQRVYEDVLAPAGRQVGGLAEDVAKTFRLFMAPFQLAAVVQDRYRVWLDDVRSRVPPERRTHAPANVAGPVLLNLRFVDDKSVLKTMYLNLLARAIDKDRQSEAHPAYVNIIDNMSPNEAKFLHDLHTHGDITDNLIVSRHDDQDVVHSAVQAYLPNWASVDKQSIYSILEHLQGLGLVRFEQEQQRGILVIDGTRQHVILGVTHFGRSFVRACLEV